MVPGVIGAPGAGRLVPVLVAAELVVEFGEDEDGEVEAVFVAAVFVVGEVDVVPGAVDVVLGEVDVGPGDVVVVVAGLVVTDGLVATDGPVVVTGPPATGPAFGPAAIPAGTTDGVLFCAEVVPSVVSETGDPDTSVSTDGAVTPSAPGPTTDRSPELTSPAGMLDPEEVSAEGDPEEGASGA